MERYRTLIGAVGLAAGLIAGSMGASAQEITIRYAGTLPITHHIAKAQQMFSDLVAEKSDGRVEVEVYPAGQLFKAHDIATAVPRGAVDMGDNLTVVWSKSSISELMDVPFLFRNAEHAGRAWANDGQLFKAFSDEMNEKGMQTVFVAFYGSLFDFSNNVRQLETPADFDGLKIRSYGAMAAEALRTLGANPVVMDPGEMYLALQRGTIDGLISGVTSIDQRKLWEVGEYATITGAAFGVFPANMNRQKWDSLPEDVKEILLDAGQEVQQWTVEESMHQDQKSLEFIKEKGVKTKVLSRQEKQNWAEDLQPVVENWKADASADEEAVYEWIQSLGEA